MSALGMVYTSRTSKPESAPRPSGVTDVYPRDVTWGKTIHLGEDHQRIATFLRSYFSDRTSRMCVSAWCVTRLRRVWPTEPQKQSAHRVHRLSGDYTALFGLRTDSVRCPLRHLEYWHAIHRRQFTVVARYIRRKFEVEGAGSRPQLRFLSI